MGVMDNKRKELDSYCYTHLNCHDGCLLQGDVCRCGQNAYFTIGENEIGYMTDDEINAAYEIVFHASRDASIKDSGNRTVFETGAVRDIQEGKGRCDLMPLDVVSRLLGGVNDPDCVLNSIHDFMILDNALYLFEAIEFFRNMHGYRTESMILEVAVHFEEGAKKYGENNWQKGIPVKRYIDSAVRHYLKYLRGDTDEPHDRAFIWNIICCIWTCMHKPELNDYAKENADA